MNPDTIVHIVTREELETDDTLEWDDPDGLVPMLPEKKRAILDNPLVGGADDPVRLIGVRSGRVVGRMDIIAGALSIDGIACRAMWGSNLFVQEAYRQSLMGVMLILKMQQVHHTVGALGPSHAAAAVYEKLRWSELQLPRYLLVCRSRPVVERFLGSGLGSRALSGAADLGLATHRAALRAWTGRRARRLEVRPVDRMSPEVDPLLERGAAPISLHRSAAWVNWLLSSTFKADARDLHQLLYFFDGERLVAYALVKLRFHETASHRGFRNVLIGSVQDWIVFEPTVSEADVVLRSLRWLLDRRADVIELCVPPGLHPGSLRKLGFLRVGSMRMMFRCDKASPLRPEHFQQPESWRIRPGDGEAFFA